MLDLLYMQYKNDVLSRISHEIRTPLNSIIGLNRIIEENPSDAVQVSDCAKKINLASTYILSLVNNILDMEQFSTGKASLSSSDFSLRQLISALTVTYEVAASEAGLNFNVVVPEPFPDFVIGDKYRLNQVLGNLLSNAVRFNKPNGNIDFLAENISSQGKIHIIRFTVSDTGIGMDEELLKKVFTPFVNNEVNDTEAVFGAGMGLTVADEIVRKMGGKIYPRSVEGSGSTFWFEIPLTVSDSTPIITSDGYHDIEGKRILIADDNTVNCSIVKHLLESYGCIVEVTVSGKDAVALFSSSEPHHYDAILLDIRMPGMDGLEACRKIRALGGEGSYSPDALTIPIIAMTANVLDSDREKSLEAGMNAHLSKPIDPDELYTILAAHIGK